MSGFGTSLDEAFSLNQQMDPQYVLEDPSMYSKNDVYDPQEIMALQKQRPSSQMQNMQNVQNMQNIQTNAETCPALSLPSVSPQAQIPIQTQIQQSTPLQTGALPQTNPVQQYPPYEYDANAIQKHLQEQQAQRKLEELSQLKEIKQSTRSKSKKEHFTDGSEGKKKGDLSKSIIFSLMILLAIAFHAFISFIFEHFVSAPGEYSLRQEAGMRLVYPLLILIVIWFAKS